MRKFHIELNGKLIIKLLQTLYRNQQPAGKLIGRLLQIVLLTAATARPASKIIEGVKTSPPGNLTVKDIVPEFMGD